MGEVMGFWDDLKRAGSALNDATDSLFGDDYYTWSCPRCNYKVHNHGSSRHRTGMAEHIYKELQVVKCQSPVLGAGCGYVFGVDPFLAYCRCTCGTLISFEAGKFLGHWKCSCGKLYTLQKHDDPRVHFSCGVSQHNHIYSVPRDFRELEFRTECKVFKPRDIAALALPNFIDRLEVAVLPRVFEKQVQQARIERANEISLLNKMQLNSARRISYRRVIVTSDGIFAEELILEN
jgi:hypothetical protein